MIEILIAVLLTIIVVILLIVILLGFFYAIDLFLDLPYVATKPDKIDTIMKLAAIKKGETIIDLGSGDGRLLFTSAKYKAHAIGYEINPFLIALTLIHAKLKGFSNEIEIYKQNLWKADLKIADVVFVYGRKKTMQKFEDFVYNNAKKGARIVVNTNPFPSKKPLKSQNQIYLYQV